MGKGKQYKKDEAEGDQKGGSPQISTQIKDLQHPAEQEKNPRRKAAMKELQHWENGNQENVGKVVFPETGSRWLRLLWSLPNKGR